MLFVTNFHRDEMIYQQQKIQKKRKKSNLEGIFCCCCWRWFFDDQKEKILLTHTYKLTQLITNVMSSCCKIGDLVGCSACNFGGNDADGVFVRVSTSSQAINPL
jgi:hypothetical protein